MSLVDVLFFSFKSNAKEFQKETKQAEKAVGDLQDSINASDKAASRLAESFERVVKSGVSALTAFASMNAIKNQVLNVAASNAAFEKQSRLLGVTAGELSAWDAAVVQAGGHAGEFTSWLSEINKKYVEMGQGNRSGAIIQHLRDLSAEWQKAGLTMSDMLALGQKFSIPQDIVLLMSQGPQKMDSLIEKYKEVQNLTDANAEASMQFENALAELSMTWKANFVQLIDPAKELVSVLGKLIVLVTNGVSFGYHAVTGNWDKMKQDMDRWESFNAKTMNKDTWSAKASGGSNMEESRRFWLSKGFTPAQVAGILANEEAESGFSTSAVGDGVRARGVFQWHPDRRAKILAGTGIDVANATHADQLKAAWWEMQQRGDDVRLRSAQTAGQAGDIFTRFFERPAAVDRRAAERAKRAEIILSQMHGDMMSSAKTSLYSADNTPAQAYGGGGKTINMTIGDVTINTQATDAKGIAADFKRELSGEYRNAIGNWDDGVRY